MKKISLPLIILLLHGSLFAQVIGDFQSHSSGDWSITSTWERWNGTTWINPAPNAPTNTDGTITILSGHTITVTTNVTIDQTIINSGGILTLNNVTLTLSNGTGTDLTVNGILNKVTSTLAVSSGQMVVNGTYKVSGTSGSISFSTGNLTFNNLSIYEHARNGGTLPVETNTIWASNSTCLLSGITNALPSNLNQTYGNFTYNCPSQGASTENLGTGFTTVNGNLSIISTGAGGLRFATTGDGTVQISGNYIQSGGKLIATTTGNRIINVNGNFSITNGTFDFSENNTGNSTNLLNIKGNFLQSGGTITQSGTATNIISTIVYNGTSAQTFTSTGTISGSVNFNLNNTAGLNLMSDFSIPSNKILTLSNGIITTNNFKVLIPSGASITRVNGYIFGNLMKNISSSSGTFEVGTINGYTPISLSPVSGTGDFTVRSVAGVHPNASGTSLLNMYWTLNGSGITSTTLVFNYLQSDLTGTETSYVIGKYSSGIWSFPGGNVNTNLNQATISGVTSFSDWTLGEPASLPVELSSFTAKVLRTGGIKLDWRTETEVNNYGFEIERSQISEARSKSEWERIGFVEGNGNSNSPKDYSFTDLNAEYGSYAYHLKQIDTDGQFEYSKIIEVDAGNIPDGFVLEQNYPNPFNPSTTIKFALAETQQVELKVFDILGNEVAELFNGVADGGKVYEREFSAESYSSGIYFYRLATDSKVENRKMLLLK